MDKVHNKKIMSVCNILSSKPYSVELEHANTEHMLL